MVRRSAKTALATAICCLLAVPATAIAEPVGGEGDGADMYQPWIPEETGNQGGGGSRRPADRGSGTVDGSGGTGWTDFGEAVAGRAGTGASGVEPGRTPRGSRADRPGSQVATATGVSVAANDGAQLDGGSGSGLGLAALLAASLAAAALLVRPARRT